MLAVLGVDQEYEDTVTMAKNRLKTRVVPATETSFISVTPYVQWTVFTVDLVLVN
jgi:hypothetical protein